MSYKAKRFTLVDEWHWIVNYSWSMRLIVLAGVLSGAEAILPLFTDNNPLPRPIFASLQFAIVMAAFIARLFAQNRPVPHGEPK